MRLKLVRRKEGDFFDMQTRVTAIENEYMKYLYRRQIEEEYKVGTISLAKFFGVKPATATEVLQKLAERDFLKYTRYYGVEFTEKGKVLAKKLLRKHRILEVLFVNFLKYDSQTACDEASRIDNYVSEELINSICKAYGHPETCPCNKTLFIDEMCMKGP